MREIPPNALCALASGRALFLNRRPSTMAHLAIKGGEKACKVEWPSWPVWGDEERSGLLEVLESGEWWYGSRVREFERAFAEFQGAGFGVTCSTGTAALEAGLLALGIGAGDEVIVPAYTFVATASSVLRVNAIPIFADILPDTLCMEPEDAERKISGKTKAIMPVHMGGYVADMDRLRRIASKHSLFVIEDACHSWGSQWKGKGTGAIGDCGAFSFQASKNITCSEGGILLTDSEELAEIARSYTNCGRGKDKPWYEHFVLGGNLRLTEFQAALLLAQLTRLESQTLKRHANAEIITDGIRDIPGIVTMKPEPRMTRRAYHFYAFRVDVNRFGISVDRFAEALSAEGVPAYPLYPYPLYKNPLFERSGDGPQYCPVSCPYYGKEIDYTVVSCPVCEQVCRDTVILPHALLLADESAMHSVVEAIRKVCEHSGELR
jgi:dTDP-4-amino-4,6-dideoxygalactose transaminase